MAQDSGAAGGPEPDSDLRRRAAWLLGMLAIVAVLLVVVMSQLVGGGGGSSKGSGGPRDLDSAVGQHPSTSTATRSTARHSPSAPPSDSAPPSSPGGSGPVQGRHCPTKQTCALAGDPGSGIAAINDYRTQHGKDAVAGRVTPDAQDCALHNGSGCSGGWAETEVPGLDGPAAVTKVLPFAHLLDNMKSFEIGWAYDPGAKLYYFAIIRND